MATKGYGADEPAETYARARDALSAIKPAFATGAGLWGQWVFRHVRAESWSEAEQPFGARCVSWARPRTT